MSNNWIDFRALREKVNMLDVLRHYGTEVKIKGDQAIGLCPLPRHPPRTDGRPRTASLSVNLSRGIFKCFGCHARGNVIDYVCFCEGLDPADPQHVRQAAVKLAEWFDVPSEDSSDRPAPKAAKPRCISTTASGVDRALEGIAQPNVQQQSIGQPNVSQEESAEAEESSDDVINPPLEFVLQKLDPNHAYLSGRGFTPETIAFFGLGFCSRGMLRNRIAIPLHDGNGTLIGYAGRHVDDKAVNDDYPKYLLPGRRKKNGVNIAFRKSRFLYNGHRLREPVDDLIVVEGFPSVWWLHQAGYSNVVGLMGADCSSEQVDLIVHHVKPSGRVWVFTDADAAGDACATAIMQQVGRSRFVRRVAIDHGQPTDYTFDELARFLAGG